MIIGITGSFGSGKSSVAGMFASLGARVINADIIAHRLMRPGSAIYREILRAFGRQIIGRGGAIERKKLARIVFGNRASLRKLNRIVHPEVIAVIQKEISRAGKRMLVLDAPLLIETGLSKEVDALIVVRSTRKNQVERLLKKGISTRADIIKRIKSQMALSKKMRLADFIIDNNGSLENTRIQVKKIYRSLGNS